MMEATFFGEINELHSRAVWYSDEEDDESDGDAGGDLKEVTTSFREKEVANTEVELRLSGKDSDDSWMCQVGTCVISVDQAKHNNQKDLEQLKQVASLYSRGLALPVGTIYLFDVKDCGSQLLWLVIDSSHPYVSGHMVGHLVTSLVSTLVSKLPNLKGPMIVSQQFSIGEHVTFLDNSDDFIPPFSQPVAKRMLPPSLIKNHFEASIFEYCTISKMPCAVFCLPDPKDYCFDSAKSWPCFPRDIVEHRLNDNKLDRSYIFI